MLRAVGSLQIKLLHLPTALLLIGYPVYWLELYVFRQPWGVTTWLAVSLFSAVALLCSFRDCHEIAVAVRELRGLFFKEDGLFRFVNVAMFALIVLILAVSFEASLLPPHLPQEHDALNYHITIPRQLLIQGSFRHLDWSSFDLRLLPIDMALAPYWLVTDLPNKIPQFLFVLGLLGLAMKLAGRLSPDSSNAKKIVLLALVGSHGIGIQMGTAMLDLTICYLCLAAVDSWWSGNKTMAVIECALYLWSKPFLPLQWVLVLLLLGGVYQMGKHFSVTSFSFAFDDEPFARRNRWGQHEMGRMGVVFLLASVLFAGPFMLKSIHETGTPLFPFGVGWLSAPQEISENRRQSIASRANETLEVRDLYGEGRSLDRWLTHWWLIAVPEKGVNNRFDYPLGLPYILFMGPFLICTWITIIRKRLPIIPALVLLHWIVWWFSSQQSRFLYAPLSFLFIVMSADKRFQSKLLQCCLCIGLFLNAFSMVRAHGPDFGKTRYAVLREKDKRFIEARDEMRLSGKMRTVAIQEHDAAFAQFLVRPTHAGAPFLVPH